MIVYIYPSVLQALSGGAMQVAWSGCFQGYRGEAMYYLGCGLPRILIPRTPVNKGKRKGQDTRSPGPLERSLPGYPDGWPMTPSCCIMPSRSGAGHSSAILPPSMRLMLMFVISTSLPVGAMPQSSP